ncbi:MAG: tRNA dihydrouridine synthase DusB [Caulobacteraceae bacterium]
MCERDGGGELKIGAVRVAGRVWIAPMTGVSDLPFRRTAARLGAPYLATEMVACAQFVQDRPDAVRRAAVGAGLPLMVVQLVGHDPLWIARGAHLAARAGAQIIDLNFGCPAKAVTGRLSGSALMRDMELAQSLISAAVEATDAPVTVKMRLGWDEESRNAPELAARAQAAGARAITVHGRTRRQFYNGQADWSAVRQVKAAVTIPVLVNGDVLDATSARAALVASGADGVMIGRGATGRPWIATTIQAALAGHSPREPGRRARASILRRHLDDSVRFHGEALGLRLFRKHLAAYIDAAPWPVDPDERKAARSGLCRLEAPAEIALAVAHLWRRRPTGSTA